MPSSPDRRRGPTDQHRLRRAWPRWLWIALVLLTALVAVAAFACLHWWLGFPGKAAAVATIALLALMAATGIVCWWPFRTDKLGDQPGETGKVELARLIARAWVVAGWAVGILVFLAWIGLGALAPSEPGKLTLGTLESITTRAFAIVAGIGGVAFLVTGYRRQSTAEEQAVRDTTRLFTERFTAASEKLGDEQPAVRLAAVHALAHLADDAPSDDLRQMVIDVLCAYLRMPYQPAPDPLAEDAAEEQRTAFHERQLAYESFREVRHTIIGVIAARLRGSEEGGKGDPRWQNSNYDFSRVVFDGGDFSEAWFCGRVSFRGARFVAGQVLFDHARLSKVDFSGAEFAGGVVSFHGAWLEGCGFYQARFCGAEVVFDSATLRDWANFEQARFTSGNISFQGAKLNGVSFWEARFEGAAVAFTSATLKGQVDFDRAWFLGPGGITFGHTRFTAWVSFQQAVLNGGTLSFDECRWEGDWLSFSKAALDGTAISFTRAKLLTGSVNFSEVVFSHPDTPPKVPEGLLEAAEAGKAQVDLPPQWRARPRRVRRPGCLRALWTWWCRATSSKRREDHQR